jgi:DNA-binding MarR family transcriptional regulator
MSEMQRCMMARLGPSGAADWLRLELTTPQLKTLFCLVSGGEQTMSHLAHKLGIGLPAATSLVDRLVDAKLVEREHSQTDRRVVLVRPNEAGEQLTTRLRAVHEDQWRRVLEQVSDEDMPVLAAGVKVMLEATRRLAEAT